MTEPYNLKLSKRKTISIRVNEDATVEVRAPIGMSQKSIEAFLAEKQDWVNKKRALMKKHVMEREAFLAKPPETLMFLGEDHEVRRGNKPSFDGTYFYLPEGEFTELKPAIIRLYKRLARQVIEKRVKFFAEKMGVSPAGIRINSARTRWGSCSGKNSLNFSWMLVMAWTESVDYVVVHELAHIKEHNHSKAFWSVVKSAMPGYEVPKAALKILMTKLMSEDWNL